MVFHLLRRQKSAQVNIEFIVAVVLLAFVIISTIIFTIRLLPASGNELEVANLRAKATALENVLLYSPGVPANWTFAPDVIGLAMFNNFSNETILGALDPVKLTLLNTTPALNYSSLRRNLSIEDADFYLRISSGTFGIMEYFNTTPPESQTVVSVQKLMVVNTSEANVTLLVW